MTDGQIQNLNILIKKFHSGFIPRKHYGRLRRSLKRLLRKEGTNNIAQK